MQRKKVGEKGKATPPCYLPEKMRILVLYTYETRIYMYAYVYTCMYMIHIISISHTFLSMNYLASVQHLLYTKRIIILYHVTCTYLCTRARTNMTSKILIL